MKYRKKPVDVHAIQLTGPTKIRDWATVQDARSDGWVQGGKGQWLLSFEDGHQEIMNDDEFRKTFDEAPGALTVDTDALKKLISDNPPYAPMWPYQGPYYVGDVPSYPGLPYPQITCSTGKR